MLELIRNAEVFAPEPLGLTQLLICAGKIIWMGQEALALPKSLGVRERDLGGLRLIPGLIDGHVHVTGGGGESGPQSRVPPLGLSELTRGGTTTVVGLLGTDDTTRGTASLLATVKALEEEGITAYCYTGGYHIPPATLTGSVRGDIVYLDRVIGVGEIAISDYRSSQPTLDEFLRIASEAHVAGLLAGKAGVLHLHVGDGPRGLSLVREARKKSELPPSVFYPTHVNRQHALFDEALELAQAGCTIDVTAFPNSALEGAWSAEEAITKYLEAKLPPEQLTVSSDGGGSFRKKDADGRSTGMDVGRPDALAKTLKNLLETGHALEKVLPVFTSNVATQLRFSHKGRIKAGADADLVVLDAAGNVLDVMAKGKWHVSDGQVKIWGNFERRGDGT